MNDWRPIGRSPMSHIASSERNSESVHVPDAASALWFVTVQRSWIGAPEITADGTTTSVTTRSDGGGSSTTIGTAPVRSLLRSLPPS